MRLIEAWHSAAHAIHWAYQAQGLAIDETTRSQLGKLQTARGGLPGDRAASLRAQASMIHRVTRESIMTYIGAEGCELGDPVLLLILKARNTLDEVERRAICRALHDQVPDYDELGQGAVVEVIYDWALQLQPRAYRMMQVRIDNAEAFNKDRVAKDYGIPRNAFRRAVESMQLFLEAREREGLEVVERAMDKKGWIVGGGERVSS